MKRILVVIPARGGSKGIPRKNIRPLNGKPLIYDSINNALNLSSGALDVKVLVSSEDDEILEYAKRFGAIAHKRHLDISIDNTTLDPVIYDAYISQNKSYDLIVTMQPTSPLLNKKSLNQAIFKILNNNKIDTIISAVNDSHLKWNLESDKFTPLYKKRVNRQFLPKEYKETGSFLISRPDFISKNNRIGENIDLYLLSNQEAIDIDTFEDWNLCEYYLKRKKILFNVSGYKEIGLGHVYNALSIANEILNHEIVFLFDKKSKLGFSIIKKLNYNCILQTDNEIVEDIKKLCPDIVINDCLNTDLKFINILKEENFKVINFEDIGLGSHKADLVINAMYNNENKIKNHFFGSKYFILRDEFLSLKLKKINHTVKNVLLTFGGVDPNDFTLKTLNSISDFCIKNNIKITVILGLGYNNINLIKRSFFEIKIVKNTKFISNYIQNSDIIFSSAGRTTFEAASLGIPTIVLCQNKRETTHFFAHKSNGFINLGLGIDLKNQTILNVFKDLCFDKKKRIMLNEMLCKNKLREGKKQVLKLIKKIIDE